MKEANEDLEFFNAQCESLDCLPGLIASLSSSSPPPPAASPTSAVSLPNFSIPPDFAAKFAERTRACSESLNQFKSLLKAMAEIRTATAAALVTSLNCWKNAEDALAYLKQVECLNAMAANWPTHHSHILTSEFPTSDFFTCISALSCTDANHRASLLSQAIECFDVVLGYFCGEAFPTETAPKFAEMTWLTTFGPALFLPHLASARVNFLKACHVIIINDLQAIRDRAIGLGEKGDLGQLLRDWWNYYCLKLNRGNKVLRTARLQPPEVRQMAENMHALFEDWLREAFQAQTRQILSDLLDRSDPIVSGLSGLTFFKRRLVTEEQKMPGNFEWCDGIFDQILERFAQPEWDFRGFQAMFTQCFGAEHRWFEAAVKIPQFARRVSEVLSSQTVLLKQQCRVRNFVDAWAGVVRLLEFLAEYAQPRAAVVMSTESESPSFPQICRDWARAFVANWAGSLEGDLPPEVKECVVKMKKAFHAPHRQSFEEQILSAVAQAITVCWIREFEGILVTGYRLALMRGPPHDFRLVAMNRLDVLRGELFRAPGEEHAKERFELLEKLINVVTGQPGWREQEPRLVDDIAALLAKVPEDARGVGNPRDWLQKRREQLEGFGGK
jgi:hypothetical protein